MKGKKIITVVAVVCLLSVLLAVPAFAAVAELDGEDFALYNEQPLPKIETVWDSTTYPYAFIMRLNFGGKEGAYTLMCSSAPLTLTYSGGIVAQAAGSLVGYNYINTEGYNWVEVSSLDFANGEVIADDVSTLYTPDWGWTNFDIVLPNGYVYMEASQPIPLDGYSLINWDGERVGGHWNDNYQAIDLLSGRIYASDAFAIITNKRNPVDKTFTDDFIDNGSAGWFVVSPISTTASGDAYACGNAPVDSGGSADYTTFALDVYTADVEIFTSWIGYRPVETPPDEGGGDDGSQPPCGG